MIIVRGHVRHGFDDEHDFEFLFKDSAQTLEKHGEAKPYVNKAAWYQEFEGTFRIADGKLVDPRFEWAAPGTEGGGPHER